MDKNAKILISVVVLLVLGVAAAVILRNGDSEQNSKKYDSFATCLKDKGAVFYGAFWCTHCQAQKKLFGASQRLLPYVECSLANAQGQTKECVDKGIKSYPTWEFADGSRLTGQVPLATLAEKTSCVLPQ